jgi:hypothetical protein
MMLCKFKSVLIIIIISAVSACAKQKANPKSVKESAGERISSLASLGREKLIEEAGNRLTAIFDDLGVKGFKKGIFDLIEVKKSDRSLVVLFSSSFKYVPLGGCYLYDAGINLIDNKVTFGPTVHPHGCVKGNDSFYEKTEEYYVVKNYVYRALEGVFEGGLKKIIVYEYSDHYRVDSYSGLLTRGCKIDRKSFEVYDVSERHISPGVEDREGERFEIIR